MRANKKFYHIPCSVYDNFYQEDTLDTLAYYFFLKRIYQKSLFYDVSWSSLAEKSGVSINTLKRHVGRLMEKGLATMHGNNLHINSPKTGIRKVKRSFLTKDGSRQEYGYREVEKKDTYLFIPVSPCNNVKEIKVILRSIPMFCSLARQANKLVEENKPNTARHVSRVKKECSSFSTYITLSNRTISHKLQRSKSTVQRYKKILNSIGIMDSRFQYMTAEDYGKIFGDPFEVAPAGALKIIDNKLCVQMSNHYRLKYLSDNFVKKSSKDSKAINTFCKQSKESVAGKSSW